MGSGDGNDYLAGGAGCDTIIGGKGDDTFVVDNSRDELVEKKDGGQDMILSSVSLDLDNFDKVRREPDSDRHK
ncbi:MAG: hypothetical protein Q8M03_07050 [Legionella sp.]|nr:hypothetical protein [Legionella sp.]